MHKLAVIGNPISHSLSPLIWQKFADDMNVDMNYEKLFSEIDLFEKIVHDFFTNGGTALSVTAPFKARAFALANQHNPHTVSCQTANLLFKKNGLIVADNTDGMGLIEDIVHLGGSLFDKNILIIGSGSVIHSVFSSIAAQLPKRIDLLMRNWDKFSDFENISNLINEYNPDVIYDVVINTTPNIPENDLFHHVKMLSHNAIAYDMIYTAKQTLFLAAMEKINKNIIQLNGIGMLIQQAKVAFSIVFGSVPEVEGVYPLLKAQFDD